MTSVSMMGTTMHQMTQNKVMTHHHHLMHKTVRMARTTMTVATMKLMEMLPPDLIIHGMRRKVMSRKK